MSQFKLYPGRYFLVFVPLFLLLVGIIIWGITLYFLWDETWGLAVFVIASCFATGCLSMIIYASVRVHQMNLKKKENVVIE